MKHVKNVQNVIFLLFHAVHKDKETLFWTFCDIFITVSAHFSPQFSLLVMEKEILFIEH